MHKNIVIAFYVHVLFQFVILNEMLIATVQQFPLCGYTYRNFDSVTICGFTRDLFTGRIP